MAIVRDLKQLEPSILNDNLKRSGASIHCIFNQFLKGMNRSHYDFAGSNLVNNILIQRLSKSISSGSDLGLLGICNLDSLWSLGSRIGLFSFSLSPPNGLIIHRGVLHI